MKKIVLLVTVTFILIVLSACGDTSDPSIALQAAASSDQQQHEPKNTDGENSTNMADSEAEPASPQAGQEEYAGPTVQEEQPVPKALNISESESLIRSPEEKNLSQIEWKPGLPDVSLPIHFGAVEAELVIGRDHPNGTRAIVFFSTDSVGWPLDLYSIDSEAFEDFGDLREDYKIQAAVHDFDGDGVNELVLAVGDSLIDLSFGVYSYTSVGDLKKISPFHLDLATMGQTYIILDGKEIVAPYGSQGLFDSYKYVDREFLQPVR